MIEALKTMPDWALWFVSFEFVIMATIAFAVIVHEIARKREKK